MGSSVSTQASADCLDLLLGSSMDRVALALGRGRQLHLGDFQPFSRALTCSHQWGVAWEASTYMEQALSSSRGAEASCPPTPATLYPDPARVQGLQKAMGGRAVWCPPPGGWQLHLETTPSACFMFS